MIAGIENFERLKSCNSPTDLVVAVSALARTFGFEHWIYALDLPIVDDRKRQFHLGGYPDKWVIHYFERGYLQIDPVIAHCQTHSTPFVWPSYHSLAEANDQQSVAARRLFQEADDFGLRAGLTIPLHGLGCSWGLVSFASETRRNEGELIEVLPQLHLLAHFIHEAGHRFAHHLAMTEPPRLTSRELECLHWVAVGKTSWEIGRLLNVTERTIVFHVQNAARKLETSGRQAAVARAIVLGLINL